MKDPEKRPPQGTPAQYKSAIAGLVPPFVIAEFMFAALAVYLFVAYPDRPQFGCVFAALALAVAAVFVVLLLALRRRAARAKGEPRGGNGGK